MYFLMFIFYFRWEDYLQHPLQPLADNLDTHTYNVFEKDPVKYDQYQKAIAQALIDLQKESLEKVFSILHVLYLQLLYI